MNGNNVRMTIKYNAGGCIPVSRDVLNLLWQVVTQISDPDWREVSL